MNIIKDKELIYNVHEYDVIAYGMGIYNSMNRGLAYEIGLNFPQVRESEKKTKYGDSDKYGTLHCVKSNEIIFVSCYCNNGGFRKNADGSYLNYEALEKCLNLLKKFKNKKIAMPLIGKSKWDGCGNGKKILSLYKEIFDDFDVDVYIDDIEDFKERMFHEIAKITHDLKDGLINKEEYQNRRSEIEWKKKNGIFVTMPEDYSFKRKQLGDYGKDNKNNIN